ncbi:MAG: alkaline phosphatase D family protein [Pseudobdellovibrionaceae bacterium]
METSRRDFLGLMGGTILSAPTFARPLQTERGRSSFTGHIPISQHMTNENSAQFSILTYGSLPYIYRVNDQQGHELNVELWDHETRKDFSWSIDKIFVGNLSSSTQYRLQVIDKKNGSILDERYFKNLELRQKKTLRFGLISCACDLYHMQNKNMWDLLFAHQPEMIFLIGDACYADIGSDGTEKDLWRRQCETRQTLSHFRQPHLIPTIAVWDDHDYGRNNADKFLKIKTMSRRCFQLFFGSKNVEGLINTFGVGFVFTGFGQRFFFMDDRYFRDTANTGGLMWGHDQQELFIEMLTQNEMPAWIFNGSQYFGNYKSEESFQVNYFKNLVDVTRKLSKIPAPVIFGSGDVHFSEVMSIEPRVLGYRTYEITSSCIHSFNLPETLIYKNPRREVSTWKQNFMIIKSTAFENGIDVSSYAVGRSGRVLFQHNGSVLRNY